MNTDDLKERAHELLILMQADTTLGDYGKPAGTTPFTRQGIQRCLRRLERLDKSKPCPWDILDFVSWHIKTCCLCSKKAIYRVVDNLTGYCRDHKSEAKRMTAFYALAFNPVREEEEVAA